MAASEAVFDGFSLETNVRVGVWAVMTNVNTGRSDGIVILDGTVQTLVPEFSSASNKVETLRKNVPNHNVHLVLRARVAILNPELDLVTDFSVDAVTPFRGADETDLLSQGESSVVDNFYLDRNVARVAVATWDFAVE